MVIHRLFFHRSATNLEESFRQSVTRNDAGEADEIDFVKDVPESVCHWNAHNQTVKKRPLTRSHALYVVKKVSNCSPDRCVGCLPSSSFTHRVNRCCET